MKYIIWINTFFLLLLTVACTQDSSLFIESQTGVSGSITRFATLGDYMYTLNPNELQTFDISDPNNPKHVSELETDYGLETIFIYDNRIYLGARTGLYILALDDPSQPKLLSQTTRSDSFFGACDPVVVKDSYAYSTVKTIENICGNINTLSALLVYEVSDPENPVLRQEFILEAPNGLAYTDAYLYVCDSSAGKILAFDITNPNEVVQQSDLNYSLQDPMDIIIDGDRMITSTKDDFVILSIGADGSIVYEKTIPK